MKARAALYAKRWQDAVNAALEVEKLEKKGVYQLLQGLLRTVICKFSIL